MLAPLVEALVVLLLLIGCTFWLRGRGALNTGDATILTRLVTELLLPAVIFAGVSRHPLPRNLAAPMILFAATIAALAAAWAIGRLCGVQSRQLGALILVSGVGSSSTLGYALIGQIFPGNAEAAFDAVMVGEIGAIVPLFVVGVPLARAFGSDAGERPLDAVLGFFRSPMFFALALGLIASGVGVPENILTRLLYRTLDSLTAALPVMVALTIGLMLRAVNSSAAWKAALIAGSIKLFLEPLLTAELAALASLGVIERDVLLIEAAMPSGALAAIIAGRHGCDGGFASALVVITYAASLASTPLVVALAPGL